MADTATSVLAGFPVFMTIGYMAQKLHRNIDDIVSLGKLYKFNFHHAANKLDQL